MGVTLPDEPPPVPDARPAGSQPYPVIADALKRLRNAGSEYEQAIAIANAANMLDGIGLNAAEEWMIRTLEERLPEEWRA